MKTGAQVWTCTRDTVVGTVRVPSSRRGARTQHTRTFGTTIRQLQDLGDWLSTFSVNLVGMEATGVYWRPVFAVLEERFDCWLLNAQHLHNVPGRKTDVADSAWICQLLEYGLVRASFVPPQQVRDARELTRLRKAQVQERTRSIQRLEKVLQECGIKLTSVASQVYSKSARAMLEALLDGVTEPAALAELAKGRLRSKRARLVEALAHRFRLEQHGVLVAALLAQIDALEESITRLDGVIAQRLAPQRELVELLCTIPGVSTTIAQVLLAECGWDMSVFAQAANLASWAGICPGNNTSGGRRMSGATRRGPKWLRQALTEAAHAAARTKGTYLGAHHAQIRGRRGPAKAIGATRHDILIAFYYIVRDRVPYRELGADWAARRYSVEHRTNRLVRQLESLGLRVQVQPV